MRKIIFFVSLWFIFIQTTVDNHSCKYTIPRENLQLLLLAYKKHAESFLKEISESLTKAIKHENWDKVQKVIAEINSMLHTFTLFDKYMPQSNLNGFHEHSTDSI